MKVVVVSTGGKKRQELELADNATLDDLKQAVWPGFADSRKSFRLIVGGGPATAVVDGLPLAAQGVASGSELLFKDLGPQIGYRTVFVVEYLGPIGIVLFYALRPKLVYGESSSVPYSSRQLLFVAMFLAHFIKRELETFFVHKFSRPTMPLINLFKNCAYYWLFALVIGYPLCHPNFSETATMPTVSNAAVGLWGLCQLGNFLVHWQLSRMRKGGESGAVEGGSVVRQVPRGSLFSLVTSPNYTFEVLGWAAFSAGSGIAVSWLFTAVGLGQMTAWARKRHAEYCRIDPLTNKKKSIIPFII